jgi:hypothetical protein
MASSGFRKAGLSHIRREFDRAAEGHQMKRHAGHQDAGSRRRVGADTAFRSTRRKFLLGDKVIE